MLKEEPNVEISSDVEFFDDTTDDIGDDDLMENSNVDLAEIKNVSHKTTQKLISKFTPKDDIIRNKTFDEVKSETDNGQESSIQCYYCSQVHRM